MPDSGFPSAQAAETAFYEAFENADHDAMMAVWGPDEDSECIHPLGERIVGVVAIGESWRRILTKGKRMRFQLTHTNRFQDGQLVVHVLYENISIRGRQQPPVIATNIYRFNGSGWHMILHHASPATTIESATEAERTGTAAQTLH